MGRTSRLLTMGFVVTLGLAGVGRTAYAAPQVGRVTIALWIRDTAQVPDDVLTGAQTEVTKIYRQAGVEIVWRAPVFPSSPADLARDLQLAVAILSRDQAKLVNQTPAAVGAAPRSITRRDYLAYVFYHRVENLTGGKGVDLAHVLGIAMAHEVGHLLLPYKAHSPTGLMRANWTKADLQLAQRSQLLFTAEQGELIRIRTAALGQQ